MNKKAFFIQTAILQTADRDTIPPMKQTSYASLVLPVYIFFHHVGICPHSISYDQQTGLYIVKRGNFFLQVSQPLSCCFFRSENVNECL